MLKFHSLRVCDVRPEAEDAVSVSFEVPEDLRQDYRGLPGQHVVLRADVAGETRRTYSLVNAPGEWPLRIVARIHPHGRMSRHLARSVQVGDEIDVLPPNGSLTPRLGTQPQRTSVGFASGCGITPLLAIAKAILGDPDAHFILLYGNTGAARTMCAEELLALKDRYVDRLAVHFLMSREPQEVALYNGRLDGDKVRELAGRLFRPQDVLEYFVCGPGDMIEQVTAALREISVPAERIHGEHFRVASAGEAAADSAADAESTGDPGQTTRVTVSMDGRRRAFSMARGGETVLDAAMAAGLELPFSCRAGVCSTCRTKVVAGAVEMEQNYALEDWELEEGYVLACQSRPTTETLELDYDEK